VTPASVTGDRERGPAATGDERLMTPAFAALSLAVLAFFVSGGVFLPATPRFTIGPLGGDDIAVGIVVGAFSISSILMRPFAGRLADRRGRRIGLVAGAIVTVVAALGHLLATDVPTLIVMRLLLGMGEALFFVAGLAAATDLAPEHRRGEAISLISLSLYLGVAIGPIIGETVYAWSGYAAVWLVAAAIAAVAVGLSWLAPETLSAASRAEAPRNDRFIDRRGIEPGLLALCGVFGMGPFFAFLPLMTDDLEIGASTYFAVFAIIVVVLRVVGAKLPDRIGAARLSGSALVVSAIGMAVAGLVPTHLGLLVGTSLFAVGVAFTFPAIIAMSVVGVPAAERGVVVGTASLFVDVAFGLSPATLGLLAQSTGYPPTFLVSGVIAAIGAAWLLIRRPGRVAPVPA
jgi:MFS family permease